MDAVRDKHHADAAVLQAAHHGEQPLAFVLVERGGRFVEDQKAAVVRQRARQQNLLLLRQRAALHPLVYVDMRLELRQQGARLPANGAPAKAVPGFGQPIQQDVLRHAELRHQRHVHLLLHQVYAESFRIARAAYRHRRAVQPDFAAVVAVRAGQHRHQRRFACAVLAHQGVHFAAATVERDILQRLNAGKRLADAMKRQKGWLAIHGNSSGLP